MLRPELEVSDGVRLLLYERGPKGATFQELALWVHPKMRKNLRRTLYHLEHGLAHVHSVDDSFQITAAGMLDVERKKLHTPT